jgi:hypothetical protein
MGLPSRPLPGGWLVETPPHDRKLLWRTFDADQPPMRQFAMHCIADATLALSLLRLLLYLSALSAERARPLTSWYRFLGITAVQAADLPSLLQQCRGSPSS